MLTKTQINELKRAKSQGVGADTKMSKTQIRKAIKQGGSVLSSLISLGTRALASKLFGRGLSTLTSGGQGLSTLRKPIGGKGLSRETRISNALSTASFLWHMGGSCWKWDE